MDTDDVLQRRVYALEGMVGQLVAILEDQGLVEVVFPHNCLVAGPVDVSGLAFADSPQAVVRVPVRVRADGVRVERGACPGSCPDPNPDTHGTRRVPVSGFVRGVS